MSMIQINEEENFTNSSNTAKKFIIIFLSRKLTSKLVYLTMGTVLES